MPVLDPVPLYHLKGMPHGFLLRHAENLAFLDCRIRWDGTKGDWKSGLSIVRSKEVDCRAVAVERYSTGAAPADWGSGIISGDSDVECSVTPGRKAARRDVLATGVKTRDFVTNPEPK